MKANAWMVVSDEDQMDTEYLKYSPRGEECEVNFILYTRVRPERDIYFPIVQTVTFRVPISKVNFGEKEAEQVINDLVLEALTQMINHGIVFNAKTTDNAVTILESMGVDEFVFDLR